MALPAEANEILLRVFTLAASPPNVMDLEPRDRPAVLAQNSFHVHVNVFAVVSASTLLVLCSACIAEEH